MPTIKDLPREILGELDFIELEISRIRAYNQAKVEHNIAISEFCKTHNISELYQFKWFEASDSEKHEYDRLAYHGPKQGKAYVLRALQNIRELSLEYGRKL